MTTRLAYEVQPKTLQGPYGKGRFMFTSSHAVCSAMILALFGLTPRSVFADDPCAEPVKQVKALVVALNKAAPPQSKPGRFEVKRLSEGTFQVSYVIDSKAVFTAKLEQRAQISDHFAAGVSRKAPSILEIGYAFGARGAVACEYAITRTNQQFSARRTK